MQTSSCTAVSTAGHTPLSVAGENCYLFTPTNKMRERVGECEQVSGFEFVNETAKSMEESIFHWFFCGGSRRSIGRNPWQRQEKQKSCPS